MVAAKDNMNTKMVTLISLVGVLFLALTIIATDAAYSWSETLAARGKEAGYSPVKDEAKAGWDNQSKAHEWIKADGIPDKKYIRVPLERAKELTLKDRGK